MKNSEDTIENRTRDLPACSTMPQPTALPHYMDRVKTFNLTILTTEISLFTQKGKAIPLQASAGP
jgi:hypothetical protein